MIRAITYALTALFVLCSAGQAAEPARKTGVLAALNHPEVQDSAVAELMSAPAELKARLALLTSRESGPAVARKGAPGAVDDAALRSGPAFRVFRETAARFSLRLATTPALTKTETVAGR
jgi:hypothetical protein